MLHSQADAENTTIAAISTPRGQGGIAVVRVSGPNAVLVCDRVFRGKRKIAELAGYAGAYGHVVDPHDPSGSPVDECIALRFMAPHSYTGEDVVELSCHGGRYLQQRLLDVVLAAGAQPAAPGEFTRRAVLSGKMTLTQAEGVADLIAADTRQAAQMALTLRGGRLYQTISQQAAALVDIMSHLVAYIDFPEEDVAELTTDALGEALARTDGQLQKLLGDFDRGMLVKEGIVTVLAGAPNAGKSTLMNLLCGRDESIVTPIAGTTRDVVERSVVLCRQNLQIPLRLMDTAGLTKTDDPVEAEGVRRARAALEGCQLVLLVTDGSVPLTGAEQTVLNETDKPLILIRNKSDLTAGTTSDDLPDEQNANRRVVTMSAHTGQGLEGLTDAICDLFCLEKLDPAAAMLANRRQQEAALRAHEALSQAVGDLKAGVTMDAVGVLVQEAIDALYSLTGQKADAAVIDRVFERFCVGK